MKLCLLLFAIVMCLWAIDAKPTDSSTSIIERNNGKRCVDCVLQNRLDHDVFRSGSETRSADIDRSDSDRQDKDRTDSDAAKRSVDNDRADRDRKDRDHADSAATKRSKATVFGWALGTDDSKKAPN